VGKVFLVALAVLVFLLFFGCTSEDQKKISDSTYSVLNPCPKLPCNDFNNFNNVLKNVLGLSALEFNVECMECAFPYERISGSYTKARLDFNGQKAQVYYKEGVCSAKGVDCGWEVCVSVEKDSNLQLISQFKEKFCPKLKSELFDTNSSSCRNEVLYDTNLVIDRCLGNYYETVDDEGKSFSVVQNETKCGYSVQRGRISCMK